MIGLAPLCLASGHFAHMPALIQWMLSLWSVVAAVVSSPAPPPPRLTLWSTVVAMVSPTPPPPPRLGHMEQLCQWMISLRSALAAVVAANPLRLLICFVGIVGLTLLLHVSIRPSQFESLPRRARRSRRASPSWVGSDAAVLAAKRGERPTTGARLGGGSGSGGGASSTIASGAGADESPASDTPKAAAASAIPEPIPALLATGSAICMMINKAPAPAAALTTKLFFVGVLLASVVKAERVRYPRPSDHQMEETQKDGEETVGKLIRSKPRS